MNRFKEALDELRTRPGAKQIEQLLPKVPETRDPMAPAAPQGSNGAFKLPYSSDPEPIVEPWK